MQYPSTYQLHVVMAHFQKTSTGFTHRCEGIRQKIFNRFAFGQAFTKHLSRLQKFLVGPGLPLRLQAVDSVDQRTGCDGDLAVLVAHKSNLLDPVLV